MLQVLILLISVTLVVENVFIIVKIDMLRYLPFFYGIFIDKSLLFLSLLVEFGLEESTTVHDIFFNISKDTVDSLSIIFFVILILDFGAKFRFLVLMKPHVELIHMESFHL